MSQIIYVLAAFDEVIRYFNIRLFTRNIMCLAGFDDCSKVNLCPFLISHFLTSNLNLNPWLFWHLSTKNLSEVLIRCTDKDTLLPNLKSLLQFFKCLSKPWCFLIDSPDFIKLHLNHSIETSTIIDDVKPCSLMYALELDSWISSQRNSIVPLCLMQAALITVQKW